MAQVSSKGEVTGKSRGNTTITVSNSMGPNETVSVVVTGNPIPKLTLSANPSSGTVAKGTTVKLTATANGNTVSDCDIYYTLDGANVTKSDYKYTSSGITINNSCTLRAVAYKDGYETSEELYTTYTIKEDTKKKLTLSASPSGGQVSKGTTVTLTAKADGSTVSGCDIYYTLDGTHVTKSDHKYTSAGITINSSCTLRAVAYKDGYETSDELYESYTIKEDIILPTSITISPDSKTIKVGDSFYASYTLTPSNATTTVIWSSDDKSIATVTQDGEVTGVKAGSTWINVETSNGKRDFFKITVEDVMVYPISMSLNTTSYIMNVGETYKLYYYYDYPDGTKVSQRVSPSVTWSSSNESVVTVTDGNLKAITTGKAWITVNSINGLSKSCSVTVRTPDPIEWSIKEVAAGDAHSLILKSDGTLWACGDNYYGQCGTYTDIGSLNQVMTDVSSIAAGESHSLILKSDGTLWACGNIEYGVLTDGGLFHSHVTPEQIMTGVASMAAGDSHSLILKSDGTLWACGRNHWGQLGDGTYTKRITPKQVMTDIVSVAAGGSYSLILKSDGTLWTCGYNRYGQLGDGSTKERSKPKQIMTGVASMAAGGYHSLILKSDGTLWACGLNDSGQLGDGTTTDRHTPVKVMDNVANVSAGSRHSLILKTDGTLWTCGKNYTGQLGDGTTTDRNTPVKVMDNVASISAGSGHSLILKSDGTLWACGSNRYGQLCDGTTVNRYTPVKLAEGNPTKIEVDKVISGNDNNIYTLSGQKLERPRKGINIVGGKKVIVK